MDIVQGIFLGIIQGLTEFFPVSSSGHLFLVKDIIGVQQSIFFDVMMHVATLMAIFAVFWKDLFALFKFPFKKLMLIIIASVPAALIGFFLNDLIEEHLMQGQVLTFMFLATAILLMTTEIVSKRRKKPARKLGLMSAVIMGCAQAVAVIPGLSRSGSTISAGVLSGAERKTAARFSFFMSIPIILGSAAYTVLKGGLGDAIQTESLSAVIAGMIAAAVTGFFAIKLMLKMIAKSNYKWFAGYLVILFIITFINYYNIVRFF